MKIDKGVNVFFSPTGGTKKVIQHLSAGLQINMDELDLTDKDENGDGRTFDKDELAVIAVPSYGGRVPAPAADKLRCLKGNRTPAVIISVYGNRASEDTLAELKEILTENGFVCIAAAEAVAEHSIMRCFGTGRPDEQDRQELFQFGRTIAQRLQEAEDIGHLNEVRLSDERPWRSYNGVPFKPEASKKCIRCLKCVKHCPVGAISKEHPEKTDKNLCISCMGCISVCPVQARKVNPVLLKAAEEMSRGKFEKRKDNHLYLE